MMIPISTYTVTTSGLTTITMGNIPATFNHLQVRVIARGTDTNISYMNFYFNSDLGSTNYTLHAVTGNGTSGGNVNNNNIGSMSDFYMPATGTTQGVYGATIADIYDYKNTSKFKTLKAQHGFDANASSYGFSMVNSGLWKSTAAITSVSLFNITFAIGSRIEVYGVM